MITIDEKKLEECAIALCKLRGIDPHEKVLESGVINGYLVTNSYLAEQELTRFIECLSVLRLEIK